MELIHHNPINKVERGHAGPAHQERNVEGLSMSIESRSNREGPTNKMLCEGKLQRDILGKKNTVS